MAITRAILICLALALVTITSAARAENPIMNPSFEDGDSGLLEWYTYAYPIPGYSNYDAIPVAGGVGEGATFDVLPPPFIPHGEKVCGLQSLGDTVDPAKPARNGGVYQSFAWTGGAADIIVSGRAYSEGWDFMSSWGPVDNGCRVKVGLVKFDLKIPSYKDVTNWSDVPWGGSDPWQTASVNLYGPGIYTLFIQAYQPSNSGLTTTLWDDVRWISHPAIIGSPTVEVGGDPNRPDTTARITWTTDIPTDSRVDYGPNSAYGQTVYDGALTTNHSILLEDLTPAGRYHFRVKSGAPDATEVVSSDASFNLPIQFSNFTATTEGTNMVIRWQTDIATTSRVEYGHTAAYGSITDEDPALATDHTVTLSGLDEAQDYHYRVWASAPLCTTRSSSDKTFFTLPLPRTSLENPSFESWQTGIYPWVQYKSPVSGSGAIDGLLGPYPSGGPDMWSPAGIQAYDGSYFIGAAADYAYKNGGVFQRIYWPPGQICSLCARFATRSRGGGFYDTRVRLGIDPDGGADPAGSQIVWWSGFSPTDDNQWYPGGVTATAGSGGVVTVFLDIRQQYPLDTHIVAIDDVTFGAPAPTSIGALKQERRCAGVEIENAVVTLVAQPLTYEQVGYNKAYVQPVGSPAGIAVLFQQGGAAPPNVGNVITLTGTLMLVGKEAMVNAYGWTGWQQSALPPPFAMSGRSLGGRAHNQPTLNASNSVCTVGSRVRIWGRVTDAQYDYGTDVTVAYIDDGSALLDHPESTIRGIRTNLVGYGSGVNPGDYVTATGVLSIQTIDPDTTPNSHDEYDIYVLITNSQDDWTSIPAGQ
ncbi:MAG: fibronectin type III domain-containing protein [Armatimonadota bacterium]